MKMKQTFSTREMKRKFGVSPHELYNLCGGVGAADDTLALAMNETLSKAKNMNTKELIQHIQGQLNLLQKEVEGFQKQETHQVKVNVR